MSLSSSASRVVLWVGFVGAVECTSGCLSRATPVVLMPNGKPISCSVAGPTITVAENVYGNEVAAVARADGGIDVVVIDQVEPCLHVGFNASWEHDGTVLGKCVQHEKPRATSRDGSQTYLVRQFKGDDKLSHVALGYVRYEWTPPLEGVAREVHPTDVWQPLPNWDHDESNGESAPSIATFGDVGFFAVWIENDSVYGVPLGASASLAMTPLDLAPDDITDLGPPSVTFSRNGRGLVAFTGTMGEGVHAYATPILCAY